MQKGKIIGGSILLAISLFTLAGNLIKGTLDGGCCVVFGPLSVIGLGLLIYGVKHSSIVSLAAAVKNKLSHSVFFNNLCKTGSVLAIVCVGLIFASGILQFEPLFIPAIIGYGFGMIFLFASLCLQTGFFNTEMPTYANLSKIPASEYLDDITFIREIKHITSGPWHQYDVLLDDRRYGWDMMKDWADYMTDADLKHVSQVTTGSLGVQEKDITISYTDHGGKCNNTPELSVEMGVLSVAGISKILRAPMKIVWINQTRVLRFFTLVEDELLIKKYVESTIRHTFGTDNAMKLGKPNPERQ